MPALQTAAAAVSADERISWPASGDIGGGVHRGLKLGAAAATKAEWCDLRPASLLTHLLSLDQPPWHCPTLLHDSH